MSAPQSWASIVEWARATAAPAVGDALIHKRVRYTKDKALIDSLFRISGRVHCLILTRRGITRRHKGGGWIVEESVLEMRLYHSFDDATASEDGFQLELDTLCRALASKITATGTPVTITFPPDVERIDLVRFAGGKLCHLAIATARLRTDWHPAA